MKPLFTTLALILAFAAVSCDTPPTEEKRSAFPEPTRYGEFDRAPRVLLGRANEEVLDYLNNFKNVGDTGEGGSEVAPRTIRIADKDRIMTVEFGGGVCREIQIVGRHGDSVLPKIPEDFESVRDAYAGSLNWILEVNEMNFQPVEFDDGTIEQIPVSGDQSWESLDGSVVGEVTWNFDNPGDPKDGDYRLILKRS